MARPIDVYRSDVFDSSQRFIAELNKEDSLVL